MDTNLDLHVGMDPLIVSGVGVKHESGVEVEDKDAHNGYGGIILSDMGLS